VRLRGCRTQPGMTREMACICVAMLPPSMGIACRSWLSLQADENSRLETGYYVGRDSTEEGNLESSISCVTTID
jgi:hypothetical protein